MAEEKRIIIDEDWKSRVEKEKADLERQRRTKEATSHPRTDSGVQPEAVQMPPASFELLLSTLATDALVALGQIPHPATGTPQPNLDQAKFFIDTLAVLQQKTQGNLTPTESQALEEVLYQLRLAFVAVKQEAKSTASDLPPNRSGPT